MNLIDSAIEQFKSLSQSSVSMPEPEWKARQKGWNEYMRLGLPTKKTETWKYSSVEPLINDGINEFFQVNGKALPHPLPSDTLLALLNQWAGFDVLITVNGQVNLAASKISDGVEAKMTSISGELAIEDGWVGLSVAFSRPGFDLHVTKSTKLVIIHTRTFDKQWIPVINRIHIDKGITFELAELYLNEQNAGAVRRSEISSVSIGDGSSLHWLRLQNEIAEAVCFSEVQVHLKRFARLNISQINHGGRWNRSTLSASLEGEGAEAHINGINFGRGGQHIDQRINVFHRVPHTISSQLFKGVLRDRAKGIINGKIFIAEGAQKVVSSQYNHNLLLSPTAEANTKPELEIYADDVKANHGASVGRMDDDRLFYLMSRGITRPEAERILAKAFIEDVLMKIESRSLRAQAERCLNELEGGL